MPDPFHELTAHFRSLRHRLKLTADQSDKDAILFEMVEIARRASKLAREYARLTTAYSAKVASFTEIACSFKVKHGKRRAPARQG